MSVLARIQTGLVAERLGAMGADVELREIQTTGDTVRDRPIAAIGTKGVFTEELEAALRDGTIDAAVHSLKDLPTDPPDGLAVGAVLDRRDVRDALVSRDRRRLNELPNGARVGTSSTRRRAQLLCLRPDLRVEDMRGNVPTRVDKVDRGEYDAAVLAIAGLVRLGLHDRVGELLDVGDMMPAPGQGALAIQCRADDETVAGLLGAMEDATARATTSAERSLLAELGGGCSAPLGACCVAEGRELVLSGRVCAPDGSGQETATRTGTADNPAELGRQVAAELRDRGVMRWL